MKPTIYKKVNTSWPSRVYPSIQGWFNIQHSNNVIHCINRLKKKITIISKEADKEFEEIQLLFVFKTQQSRKELPQSDGGIFDKPIANT